jgi:type I restriction enzyme S subunit
MRRKNSAMGKEKWPQVRLGEVIEIISGGTPKTSMPQYWNGTIPWLTVADFNTGTKYVISAEKSITEEGLENSNVNILNKDDIVISARGTVGALAVLKNPMSFNQSCYGIKGKQDISYNDFVYYVLKYSIIKLKKIAHGSVFSTITRETFDNIEISLPPIPTQRAIAATLSCIDDKIALNNRINTNLEAQAQAIFKSWFVDFEPFKGGKFIDSKLGQIPKGWRVLPLGETCDVKGGKRLPKGENLSAAPNKHPYIRVRDLNGTVFVQMTPSIEFVPDNIQAGISQYTVSSNDVVISIVGTVGLVCIVHSSLDTANLTENCVKLTNYNGATSAWLFLFLSSDKGQEQIHNVTVGAVQSKLPIKNIQGISFILPPADVMLEFDRIVSSIFKLIGKNCVQSRTLAAIRDTLLPKLMSGEIEVEQ